MQEDAMLLKIDRKADISLINTILVTCFWRKEYNMPKLHNKNRTKRRTGFCIVPVLLVIIGSRNCCRDPNIALLAVAAWKHDR